MKKLFLMFLVTTMLLSAVGGVLPVFGAVSLSDSAMFDSFDDYASTGALPNNWHAESTSNYVYASSVCVDSAHGNSVKLTWAKINQVFTESASSGKLHVSFETRTNDASKKKLFTYLIQDAATSPTPGLVSKPPLVGGVYASVFSSAINDALWNKAVFFNQTINYYRVNTIDNGSDTTDMNSWNVITGTAIENNRWYSVDIIADFNTRLIDYYIDGIKVNTVDVGFGRGNPDFAFDGIVFNCENAGSGTSTDGSAYYIDNVYVNHYDTDEDVTAFATDGSKVLRTNGSVNISFSEPVNIVSDPITAADISVTRVYDNQVITGVGVAAQTDKNISLSLPTLDAATRYRIKFNKSISSKIAPLKSVTNSVTYTTELEKVSTTKLSSNFNSYTTAAASAGTFPVAEIPALTWGKTGTGGTLTAPQNPNNSTTAFGIASAGTAYAQYNTPRAATPIGEGEKFLLEFDFCSERGGYAMVMNPSTGWGCWSVPFFVPNKTGAETTCTIKYFNRQWDIQSASERTAYLKNTGLTYTYGTWAHMKIWCDRFNGETSASVFYYQIIPYGGSASNIASGNDILYNRGLEAGALNLKNISQVGAALLKPDSGPYSVAIDNLGLSTNYDIPAVSRVEYIRCDGEKATDNQAVCSATDTIKVEFFLPMDNATITNQIEIKTSDNVAVEYEGTMSADKKTYSMRIDSLLLPNTNYTIKVPQSAASGGKTMSSNYVESFSTGAEEFIVKSLTFKNANGESISLADLNVNDVITLNTEVAKTTDSSIDFYLMAAAYTGSAVDGATMLSDANLKKRTLSAIQTGVFEENVTITITTIPDKLKAFLWDYNTAAPLCNAIEAK